MMKNFSPIDSVTGAVRVELTDHLDQLKTIASNINSMRMEIERCQDYMSKHSEHIQQLEEKLEQLVVTYRDMRRKDILYNQW